jgi:hypothetical protein
MDSNMPTTFAPLLVESLDLSTLDPGIRDVVAKLREQGFNTTDSGDGVSKSQADYATGCAIPFPHVVACCAVDALIDRTIAMQQALDWMEPGWTVEGSYSPKQGTHGVLFARRDEADQ